LGNSIDWVYTGKMLYGLNDLMLKQALPEGRTVVAWMTGNACQPGGSLAVGDY
jgi:1-aminocyclopropane-1-carboxylate deaminase/D-cysteine desulfhydrase-like pyridoxal-dependent ACC family enzyme